MFAGSRHRWVWCVIGLTAMVVFVHQPLLRSFFGPDDAHNLYVGSRLQSWWRLLYDREAAVEVDNYFYRPLARFALSLDWRLFGLNPFGYHLLAVALLLAIGVSLAALLHRISQDSLWAWLAPALLLLSPVATATAAWISNIHGDLQGGLLYLGSIVFFVRYRLEGSNAWYLISLTLAAASLFSKETMVTLPLVLLIVDGAVGGTQRVRALLLSHLPFFGLLTAYLALRTYMLDGLGGYPYVPITASSYVDRLSRLPVLLIREMSALFPVTRPAMLASGLVMVAYLLIWAPRRLLFYLTVFLLLLAPVVPLLGSMVSGPRYFFLPAIVAAIALADAFCRMLRSPSGGTRIAAVLAGLLMTSSLLASSWRLAEGHLAWSNENRRATEAAWRTLQSAPPMTTKVFFVYDGWPRSLAGMLSLLSADTPRTPFAVLRPAPYLASWGLAERLSSGEAVKVFLLHNPPTEWEDISGRALSEIQNHLASRRDPPPILTLQTRGHRVTWQWQGVPKSQPVHLYVGKGDRGIYAEEFAGYRGDSISGLLSTGQYEVALAYQNADGGESQMTITSVKIDGRRAGGAPLAPDHF